MRDLRGERELKVERRELWWLREREREFRWQKRIEGKETPDGWEEGWMWEKEILDDKSILIIIIIIIIIIIKKRIWVFK